MLDDMHGTLVDGIVCLVTKPILIALFDGGHCDDKEERQTAGDGTGWSVYDELHQKYNEEVEVGYPPELFKQVLRYEVPECVLGGDYSVVRESLWDVGLGPRRGFFVPDVDGPTVHPVLFPRTVSTDEVPKRAKIHSCDRCQVVSLCLLLLWADLNV